MLKYGRDGSIFGKGLNLPSIYDIFINRFELARFKAIIELNLMEVMKRSYQMSIDVQELSGFCPIL